VAQFHYYLGPYVVGKLGEQSFSFGPAGCADNLSLCTAEHDAAVRAGDSFGLAVFWSPASVPQHLNPTWLYLGYGDCREIKPDTTLRDAWEQFTGFRPEGDTLAAWMFSQLTRGSDPAREAAQAPLVPTLEGNLELVLNGHGRVLSDRFEWGKHSHTNRLRALLQRNLNEYRREAADGKCRCPKTHRADRERHRKAAKAMCEKYGIANWSNLKPAAWDADETPLPHDTDLADAFTGANGTTLDTYSGGGFSWGNNASLYTIQGNRVRIPIGASRYLRAESDLSTADDYCQLILSLFNDGFDNHQVGPLTRNSSSTTTGYTARTLPIWSPDQIQIATVLGTGDPVAQVAVANTTLVAGDVIKITSSGSTHTAYRNGVSVCSGTNSSYSGGTRCGVFSYSGSNNTEFDDWQAGDGTTAPPMPAAGQPASARLHANGYLPSLGWQRGLGFTGNM
jgi:hypothetical protein